MLSQSFALQDRAPILSEMDRIERQISVSDERGTSLESAISIARDELVNGRAVMGYHHLSVMALGHSIKEAEFSSQAITKELQNSGMVVVREDLNAEPVFYAQLPGNFSYIARRALIRHGTSAVWRPIIISRSASPAAITEDRQCRCCKQRR
ncbi:hypothetical protein ACOJBM_02215 [Rhizobium beringeri]